MSLRRVPPAPAAADDTSDPILLDRIRAEIERNGPLTFARFLELALYDRERGYYRAAAARPGRSGDFLTAPEAHPLFGRTLARFVAAVDRALGGPDPLTIVEHGAGTGALAASLLDGLEAADPAIARRTRYRPIEVEPRRVETIRERLAGAGRADALDDGDGAVVGLVLANEVLDALPFHRVVRRDGALREIRVGWSGDGPVDVETEPSTEALAARLAADGVELAEGQRAEICLALDRWIAEVAAGLARGVLLLVDYGHPAADLYDPRRRAAGTLATYRGHTVGADPYRAIGRQDITAHVDITAVERAAAAAGLDHLGTTTQGRFLAGLGLGEALVALQTEPAAELGAYLEARSAVVRMIDPAAMGGFRVLAFGRGLGPTAELPGLA